MAFSGHIFLVRPKCHLGQDSLHTVELFFQCMMPNLSLVPIIVCGVYIWTESQITVEERMMSGLGPAGSHLLFYEWLISVALF